ncbi:MAG TPA: hypothetical protein VFV78_01570 [Vicinamibacterales bacterium]|nr:hypothetical protein [Vicinamibacterales bacterium]
MDSGPERADRSRAMADRLRTACELWTAGVELQRQRFRREHPNASPAETDRLVSQWLRDRPGAQLGDGPQGE